MKKILLTIAMFSSVSCAFSETESNREPETQKRAIEPIYESNLSEMTSVRGAFKLEDYPRAKCPLTYFEGKAFSEKEVITVGFYFDAEAKGVFDLTDYTPSCSQSSKKPFLRIETRPNRKSYIAISPKVSVNITESVDTPTTIELKILPMKYETQFGTVELVGTHTASHVVGKHCAPRGNQKCNRDTNNMYVDQYEPAYHNGRWICKKSGVRIKGAVTKEECLRYPE